MENKNEKRHFSYSEAIRHIASGSWGVTSDIENVEKLVLEKFGAGNAASIFWLKLAIKVIDSIAHHFGFVPKPSSLPEYGKSPPTNAKPFHDKHIGEYLYSLCDNAWDGIRKSIIIAKNENGFVQVIAVDGDYSGRWKDQPVWAVDWYFATPEEALRNQAEEDVKWYKPRLEFAENAIKDANNGNVDTYFDRNRDLE